MTAGRGSIPSEARWPMAGAVLAAIVLTAILPASVRIAPRFVFPAIEAGLLVVLVAGDPAKLDRRARVLRPLSIVLVGVLVVGALWATEQLVDELIHGGAETNSASDLLAAGAVVWVSNNIAFALLYWQWDGGGAAARYHSPRDHPDLAFPQQMNPHLGPPGWRPRFIDYLYLGFTNATAFSPTDVMPLAAWAKITMTVQSIISITILGLVIARAVNVLT